MNRTPRDRSPARLSRSRKLLYGAVACVAFFVLLELALSVCGVRPAIRDADPFVGFSGQIPLFVERNTGSGPPLMVTAENRLALFNPQSFLRHKPSGTYRVFCLGGSTTYGQPYGDKLSFVGWLRAFLPEMDPSRQWEVINAGGISYASYRVAVLMEELRDYEPDLFVIYMGHNEFLEDRTYSSLVDKPESVRRLIGMASRTRTYSFMQRMIRGAGSSPARSRQTLPEEVEALLDHSVGPSAYHRDDRWRRQVLIHFRSTLERIIGLASDAGARVMLVVPASNLRDCAPFKSEHRDDLTNEELREFLACVHAGQQALETGDFRTALSRFDRAIEIDPRHADAHFLRGRALLGAGDAAAARAAFLQAREEDVCPLRALTEIQQIVRDVAAQRHVQLVDFASLMDREAEHGIPGADWFLDQVHPTIAGNQRLAGELAMEFAAQGIAKPRPSWSPDGFRQVAQRIEEQIDPREHAAGLRNLAKVLSWAGKLEEADRLALQAAEDLPDDAEASTMAGFACLRRGQIAEARTHFEAALRVQPKDVRALGGLGDVFSRNGQHEEARDCFARAVAADPKHAPAQFNLGNALRNLGQLDRAANAYRSALTIEPDQPDTHKNLGLVLAAQGDIDGAVRHFETALELERHVPERHTDLGFVLIDAGDYARSAAEFQAAVAIDPAFVPALLGMAVVYEQRGDMARSSEYLRRAAGLDPNNSNLHFAIARQAAQQGNLAAAKKELEIVLTLDPGHVEARRLLEALGRP